MPLTRQQNRLLDAAEAIQLDPDKTEAAFIARQLVQATLPHKDPGNVPAWSRTNGNLTLGITPGCDYKNNNKSFGIPYGTIPRLLMFWMTTEAVRTQSPRLELGKNLTVFMRELGLNPDNGSSGAKRSDARRLRAQMDRLFHATISFQETKEAEGRTRDARVNMTVAAQTVFWWDEKSPDQETLWDSWIKLGDEFFKAITAAPVPVDMRALRALKRSPLALDLYAWATYSAYRTQKSGQSRSVSWQLLHKQLGAEYADLDNFAKKARLALRKVQAVYPELGLEFKKGGIRVLPCNPAVTIKRKRPKTGDN